MVDLTAQIFNDYTDGRLIRLAQKSVVYGYELAGIFPMQSVDAKNVSVIESSPIDKFKDKTGKEMKVAKGAQVRQVIGKVETTDGLVLTHYEMQYSIENELIETNPTFDIYNEIRALCFPLCDDVENTVAAAFRASAKMEVDDSVTIHGKWDDDATVLEHLTDDISEFKAVSRLSAYKHKLFAYGNRANVEMSKRIATSLENYTLPSTGFEIEDTMNFMNSRHAYGGRYMNDGEVFGIDPNNPGLKIFFKDFKNPNVQNAPVPQGMEKLAPPMRMLMYDTSKTDTEPKTIIKVALAVGAYPIRKGEGLFRYEDVLA